MNLVFFLLRNSRGVVVGAVLAGVLSGLTHVGMMFLIHRALNPHNPFAHSSLPGMGMVWLFAGLCLAALVTKVVSQTMLVALARKSIARLSLHLSKRILATPLKKLEELGPSRLLAILTNDVPTIAQGLKSIPTVCINAVLILGCLVFLAWLSPVVLLSILGLLLVGLAFQRILGKKARKSLRHAREKRDSLTKHYRGLVEGVKELKIHRERREAFLTGPLKHTAESMEKEDATGHFMMMTANGAGRFMVFALIGFLVFVLPHFTPIESSAIHGYVIALMFMMAPLQSFSVSLPALARAQIALNKVESLRRSLPAGKKRRAKDQQSGEPPVWSCLELVGATHAYQHERDGTGFTLGPIDLVFRPAELVFVVGGNGSGKTTFAKLLVGLYHPEAGEIRLDGKTIGEAEREAYRQLFTVVFADFYLFESLLGLKSSSLDSQALTYLAELHLDHKVEINEGVLSTTNLSRGQRKRLALLTAYLEDRPIYVFDEWASDQDPLFKEVFYTQILPQLKAKGKLVLVITHDDRYHHLADRLIHLSEGKIVSREQETEARPAEGTAEPHSVLS